MSGMIFEKRAKLKKPILMIPGPVEVKESVLEAMGASVVPHYGTGWTDLYNETTEALREVFQTNGDIFILISSGSGGIECAIKSLFLPGESIIVVENGYFGERIVNIARFCGLDVIVARSEWGSPIDPDTIKKIIIKKPKISGLVSVHHETSTGILNPIEDLGKISKEYEIPFVVDAVSSLGGEEFRMDDWGIDICITASNKCLESISGLAPIAVGANAWKIMKHKTPSISGWYLNLRVWKQYAEDWSSWHPFPVTMATNSVLALNVALEELMIEGIQNRIKRYQDEADYFRREITDQGYKLFAHGKNASSTISVIRRPRDIDVEKLIAFLLVQKNIRIAGGLGKLKGLIMRVGHMGNADNRDAINVLISGLTEYLHQHKMEWQN